MTRELLLLRHGKTEGHGKVPDKDRRLTKRGKRQSEKIGAWLRQHGALPDMVLSSPAERAYATAHIAMKAAGQSTIKIHTDERLYTESTEQALSVLAEHRAPQRLLVIGHNPWMEELVRFLAANAPAGGGDMMRTGTLVRLALPDEIGSGVTAGCASILDHLLPDSLPD